MSEEWRLRAACRGVDLVAENQRLRQQLDALRHAADNGEHWFEQWEHQATLRIAFQNRLVVAAHVLHRIERLYPHTQPVIDRARKDIWG